MLQQPKAKDQAQFPFEVVEGIEDLKVGERETRNNDFFFPVRYQGKRLRIQTPELYVMFGLTKHQLHDSSIPKYSLHFSIRPVNYEVKIFNQMLDLLDTFAEGYKMNEKSVYWSQIRRVKDPTKTDLVRVKIPLTNNSKKLIVDIIDTDGKVTSLPTEEQFRNLIRHHTKVKCILEVNPIWYSGQKYGISYRILKLQIVKEHKDEAFNVEFRTV